jgi:site-specific recombinase XerD
VSGTELDATTQCAIAATNCRRHSLATHMLEKGASTREVQHQLTHSSLELIERYAKVTRAGLSRVMSRIA